MFENVNPSANKPPMQNAPGTAPKPAQPAEQKVYTMPMEYYLGEKTVDATKGGSTVGNAPAPSKPTGGSRKKSLTILIVVVMVLLLIGSGVLLYLTYVNPTPAPAPAPQLAQGEQTVPAPEVKQPEVTPPVTPPAEQTPPPVTTDAGAKVDLSKINKFNVDFVASTDKDNDGLTDEEESVLGTNPDLIDTDGDTYSDGTEFKSGYSPSSGDGKKLDTETSIVNTYNNTAYAYKLLYPANWVIRALDSADPKEVVIASSSNEMVTINVATKKSTESLEDWYLSQVVQVDRTQLKTYTTSKGINVLESSDGFNVVFSRGNDVFVINYNIGLKENAFYPHFFEMIVQNFEFLTPDQVKELKLKEDATQPADNSTVSN